MTVPMSVMESDYDFFVDFLRKHSAISLPPGKEYLIEARLKPLAAETGLQSVGTVIAALRQVPPDSSLVDRVVEAMTTNETSFFRDVSSFAALRSTVLPEVVGRNESQRRLSVWSAACSTGQELYAIAMSVFEDFPITQYWDLTLHGTDLSTQVLHRARAGRFSPLEINRGLPAQLLVKYFEQEGREYVAHPTLRDRVRFSQLNLAKPWSGLSKFDIVFCRNVLIYFDQQTRERILGRISSVLNPGGFLFLGPGESSTAMLSEYTQRQIGSTIVYQLKGSQL